MWTEQFAKEGIPHTRGDEPYNSGEAWKELVVFPTRVGMNRWAGGRGARDFEYSPHAWG